MNQASTHWWQQARFRRLGPALMPWVTALVYLVAWPLYGTAFSEHLLLLMELEFIALHAGAFLGFLAFWNPSSSRARTVRWAGLAVFGAVYAFAGWAIMGLAGLIEIVVMLLATYGGLLFGHSGNRLWLAVEVGVRWFLALVLFMVLAGLTGAPSAVDEWIEAPQVLLFGAIYFACLGALEFSGLYRLIRSLGAKTPDGP